MKKIWPVFIAALLVLILASGCATDNLASYKKAALKTEAIKKGQTSLDFTAALNFNTAGLTENQIKNLNYFKNAEGSINVSYDKDAHKTICRNNLNFDGLGFDADLYLNGNDSFIKIPIIGKYMRIDEMLNSAKPLQESQKNSEFISKETLETMSQTWLNLIKREDVFSGQKIIRTTPDGEVKATKYTIRLKDDQLKSLIGVCIDAISKDEKLKSTIDGYLVKNSRKNEPITFDKLLSEMKKSLGAYQVENFSYEAYVDIDGYIVNEIIEIALKFQETGHPGITYLKYKLEAKNWDINKEQHFDFPVLTGENTLIPSDAKQNLPLQFQDFFANEK